MTPIRSSPSFAAPFLSEGAETADQRQNDVGQDPGQSRSQLTLRVCVRCRGEAHAARPDHREQADAEVDVIVCGHVKMCGDVSCVSQRSTDAEAGLRSKDWNGVEKKDYSSFCPVGHSLTNCF